MPENHISKPHTGALGRPSLYVLAIDHRSQFEEITARCDAGTEGLSAFKRLAVAAAAQVSTCCPGIGIIADGAPCGAAAADLWTARPIEAAGTKPIQFVTGADAGSGLPDWPKDQVIEHLYAIGLHPNWWKLEPHRGDTTWGRIGGTIARYDPSCKGVVILGLTATLSELAHGLASLAMHPVIRGYAGVRAIPADILVRWLTGAVDDDRQARDKMAERFGALIAAWSSTRTRPLQVAP